MIYYLILILLSHPILADSINNVDPVQTVFDSLRMTAKSSPKRTIKEIRLKLRDPDVIQDPNEESKYLNILGEIYLDLDMPTLALSNFIEVKQKSTMNNAWVLSNIGNVYFQQKNWIQAKKYYEEALEIFQSNIKDVVENESGITVCLSNLGRIEKKLNHYESALQYFKQALDQRLKNDFYQELQKIRSVQTDKHIIAVNHVLYQYNLLIQLYIDWEYINIALEQTQSSDSLLNFFTPMILSFDESGYTASFKRYYGVNKTLKMRIYSKEKKYSKARSESKEAISYLEKSPFELVSHFQFESDIYIKQNKVYLALEAIDNGIRVAVKNGMLIQEIDLLNKKALVLEKNNLERSALDITKTIDIKKSNIYSSRVELLVESLNYKDELYDNRKQLQSARTKQFITLIIFILTVIVLGVIIFSYKSRKIFFFQQKKIEKQEKIIDQNEFKEKENELMMMSANNVSKNDLLKSIEKDLDYHISLLDNDSDKKLMKPLLKRIKDKIDDSADWDNFQIEFSMVFPYFIEKITKLDSNVSASDIKLCCYIKLGMKTKEIAKFSGLSIRAVENQRYRLRKKINIPSGTSLDSYVFRI